MGNVVFRVGVRMNQAVCGKMTQRWVRAGRQAGISDAVCRGQSHGTLWSRFLALTFLFPSLISQNVQQRRRVLFTFAQIHSEHWCTDLKFKRRRHVSDWKWIDVLFEQQFRNYIWTSVVESNCVHLLKYCKFGIRYLFFIWMVSSYATLHLYPTSTFQREML